MSDILVSAIVSTYNAEKFFQARIENLLRQTIGNQLEIIVIDSGSQQSEAELVKPYITSRQNIRYIKTERETLYSAWNRGVKAASGKYLSNANCDDRLIDTAYEKLVDVLEKNPQAPLAYSDSWETLDEDEVTHCEQLNYRAGRRRVYQPDYSHNKLLLHCYIGAFPMWRRDAHDRFGFFDATYVVAGDWEFWLRMAENSKFVHVPEPLGLTLRRDESIVWSNQEKMLEENHKLRRKYFGSTRS